MRPNQTPPPMRPIHRCAVAWHRYVLVTWEQGRLPRIFDSTLLTYRILLSSAQARNYFKDVKARRKLAQLVALPLQTFYIPLPEAPMFSEMFVKINSAKTKGPVVSVISLAISTDRTVVWYDNWEDGFDLDVTNATASTTGVWGDGQAANGCAPDVDRCTDEADILNAGDSIVIQNKVELPRDPASIRYDGGDRLQASFPVSVTRGSYPSKPGSLMAGAVEVLDTESWGTRFESPVGENIVTYSGFQYSALFFMAANDDTTVTLPNATTITLHQGQGTMVRVNQGDKLSSDKIIQVDLITGDTESIYELRWYSLLDVNEWSKEYVSPVGDTFGKTKMVLYNPGPQSVEIMTEYLVGVNQTRVAEMRTVAAGKHVFSPIIPTDSGGWLTGTGNFIALSLTDSEYTTSDGQKTGGQWYDWGFPVLPRQLLTSQVFIGWGYGCTDNNCYGQKDRSVVWVTPTADADIYVDYNNTGANYTIFPRKALSSTKFTDTADTDMSGATIFATKPGSGALGPPVDIAAAWGQDPSVSRPNQQISLDLGTVVLPFTSVRVNKVVDKLIVNPGETLTYTIRISNVGHTRVKGGLLRIFDVLDEHVTYVENSATYSVSGVAEIVNIADDVAGTKFPLDESGFLVTSDLVRRGGMMDIKFEVVVDSMDSIDAAAVIRNMGIMKQSGNSNTPFEVFSTVEYSPAIHISNTVYLGKDVGASCGSAVEFVEGKQDAAIVYCFNVTNTGFTHLNNITLEDQVLSFANSSIGLLAPGESIMVALPSTIPGNLTNIAVVTGNPVFANGTDLTDQADVSHSDPSAVGLKTTIDGDPKDGDKPPYSPPGEPKNSSCLQDSWDDAGNDGDLICTTQEVYMEALVSEPMTCVRGETITVNVSSSIFLESTRYDLGWYIAADDGDALEGVCIVNGLQEAYAYNVDGGGFVSWGEDHSGGNDSCGDFFLTGNGGGSITIPVAVDAALICADDNQDGKMDFTVCFTWRLKDTDEFCTLEDEDSDTVGRLADLYPGGTSMCYCASYDIPTIDVVNDDATDDTISPC